MLLPTVELNPWGEFAKASLSTNKQSFPTNRYPLPEKKPLLVDVLSRQMTASSKQRAQS